MGSFLDTFQKIADAATNTKGEERRDRNFSLFCLRQLGRDRPTAGPVRRVVTVLHDMGNDQETFTFESRYSDDILTLYAEGYPLFSAVPNLVLPLRVMFILSSGLNT